MTKSEIFKSAHAKAKILKVKDRLTYAEAFKFALRRVYNEIDKAKWMAQPIVEKPQFMWLRGM